MRPRISIRGSVRPSVRRSVGPSVGPSVRPSVRRSVRPERVFSNEPVMDENVRKWLGKQSKRSQLIKMSSKLSLNVPKCLKMSQNVKKCRKMSEPIMKKMVGNDWENILKGPNSSKSLPNCPKMSQNAHFRRIVVRTDLLYYDLLWRQACTFRTLRFS